MNNYKQICMKESGKINMDYKKVYAMKKVAENRIKTIAPQMQNKCGIYVWYRPVYKFYAGQSVKLTDRSISHLLAYDHLGLSIKKHGLFSDKNPNGWKLTYLYCEKEELDEKEKQVIADWSQDNIAYNITGGGQGKGKVDINQRESTKGYRDGLKQGYNNAIKEIRVLFDKYLNATIKEPLNKVKERKLAEFEELLNGKENGNKTE